MPANMGSNVKAPFQALNGGEIARLIGADVMAQIGADSRFRSHLVYPQVAFRVTVVLECYPPTQAGDVRVDVSGRVGDAPEGKPDLAIPVLTAVDAAEASAPVAQFVSGNLAHERPRLIERVPGGPPHATLQPDVVQVSPEMKVMAAQIEALTAMVARLAGQRPGELDARTAPVLDPTLAVRAEIDKALEGVGLTVEVGAVKEEDARPDARQAVHAMTHAGLPIEGGAVAPPHGRDPRPFTSQSARVITNPNEARRELGIEVPHPQPGRQAGTIVDLAPGAKPASESF